MTDVFIHSSAIVETSEIGEGTHIWAFTHVMREVPIGAHCNIGGHCFIESGATIGNQVTIKNGNMIWEGVQLEDGVFVGPQVVFTNDLYPRAVTPAGELQTDRDWKVVPTIVRRGASIGSGSTILCGIEIGEDAIVGAGSVVTRDVPAGTIVAGNPARVLRKIQREA